MALIAAALPVLGAIGAGVSAVGAVEGGIANKNAADYQAAVASNNAIVANQNATYAEQAGAAAGEAQGRKGAAKGAELKVAQGANGVDVNTGSAVDVQAGERETNLLDTATTLHNSQLQAYGYRTQATNFTADSQLDTLKGDQAEEGGYLNAAGGLLSSASSIGGKWTGSIPNVPGFNPIAGITGQ